MTAVRQLMIVDDDDKVRFVLSRALQPEHTQCEVSVAGDAETALQLLDRHPFDLVITDINLPGASGVELTKHLLAESPSTAVIWITAYGCHRMAQDPEYKKIAACLGKPISIDRIRKAALKALQDREEAQSDGTQSSTHARLTGPADKASQTKPRGRGLADRHGSSELRAQERSY